MDLWRGMNGSTRIPLEPSPWGSPYQVACPEIQPLLYPLAASKLLENTPGSPARVMIRTSTPAMHILSATMIDTHLFHMAHPVIFFSSMIPHSLLLKHFYNPIIDIVITSRVFSWILNNTRVQLSCSSTDEPAAGIRWSCNSEVDLGNREIKCRQCVERRIMWSIYIWNQGSVLALQRRCS